ncbi:hypothetical protein OAF43_00665 [bacterium]|nr:hypothetical protein [bacterium]
MTGQKLIPLQKSRLQLRNYNTTKTPKTRRLTKELTSGAKYDKLVEADLPKKVVEADLPEEAKEALTTIKPKERARGKVGVTNKNKPTRAATKYDNNDRYREVEGRKLQDQLMEIEVLIKEHAKGYENEEPQERRIRKIVAELMKELIDTGKLN